ncbi:MAG: hypothetical protein Q8J64_07315 [Thermodesulfovibrionales bacterium]|nr:hypothetical protein [Thermodesulfovibrionales bacterium]
MTAEGYYAEGNWKLAVREYDTAMHFYTPLSPYVERSAQRLWQIGEMFEQEERFDWANIAYSSIRSSFYASRSLYTPGKDWIKKCDEKIAGLNVRILIREGSVRPEDAASEKARHLYAMNVDRAPRPLWAALAVAGFFGWIGSVIFIIFKGFAHGKTSMRHALYGAASFALSFSVWVLALLRA